MLGGVGVGGHSRLCKWLVTTSHGRLQLVADVVPWIHMQCLVNDRTMTDWVTSYKLRVTTSIVVSSY